MHLKRSILFAAAGVLALVSQASQAVVTIDLYGTAINVDGTETVLVDVYTTVDPAPAGVSLAGFDTTTGLGTITATITGLGAHTIDLFVDHEIDESTNTFYNEFGAATGVLAAGQSWEIDEPGYVSGDIYDNFKFSTLDNTNGVPSGFEDDVSMALGWDFTLAADETARIIFELSTVAPAGGFYLTHTDPDSNASIYFNSALEIRSEAPGVPAPATLVLMAAGVLGLGGVARRRTGRR